MAIFCITTSNPEFQKLLAESGEKQGVFAMMVSKWMTENEVYDRYPTLQELGISPIKSVDNINYQLSSDMTTEEFIASEKTIRDLAARIADRIGIPYKIESDRTKEYKGKIENGVAYINLAYATLDTPIHEILGHPIIRAIKGKNKGFVTDGDNLINNKTGEQAVVKRVNEDYNFELTDGRIVSSADWQFKTNPTYSQLYQNLLKELEYGKGKEILDRVKRDYVSKGNVTITTEQNVGLGEIFTVYSNGKIIGEYTNELEANKIKLQEENKLKYTIEEQQEEAIVELLGLYTAGRLDKVKDGKLISLLKRLLKEMKAFMKQLLGQKEVEISKLPDNMTIGDLADLLAYSNSKLILPGNEVIYTTPDNQKFKTYAEASKHISDLAKNAKDVDLSKVELKDKNKVASVDEITVNNFSGVFEDFIKVNSKWYNQFTYDPKHDYTKDTPVSDKEIIAQWNARFDDVNEYSITKGGLEGFIEKNKEYEQSREIIEEWKKVNNIQYNPEEAYSRGQEFIHIHNAYGSTDTITWLQNLISNLEDINKVNGVMEMSFLTYFQGELPDHVIRNLNEKAVIKIIAYPKSKDIVFASKIDNYTSSYSRELKGLQYFIDLSKVSKREELAVNYTKSIKLSNLNTIEPNIADTIDDVAHHNEYAINIADGNFRIEYGKETPYTIKKIIDSVNSILDQKYGKVVKPKIKTGKINTLKPEKGIVKELNTTEKGTILIQYENGEKEEILGRFLKDVGIQPTQTNETLKESINTIRDKVIKDYTNFKTLLGNTLIFKEDGFENNKIGDIINYNNAKYKIVGEEKENSDFPAQWELQLVEKEYTSQALINTKIAKLKEVAKKYPRSLITSEVKPQMENADYKGIGNDLFEPDELPFQKIPGIISQTGLDMSNAEAKAFNSLVNDGTIPIKCE